MTENLWNSSHHVFSMLGGDTAALRWGLPSQRGSEHPSKRRQLGALVGAHEAGGGWRKPTPLEIGVEK